MVKVTFNPVNSIIIGVKQNKYSLTNEINTGNGRLSTSPSSKSPIDLSPLLTPKPIQQPLAVKHG